MPRTFDDTTISNWAQSYERELTAKHDLICDRLSLPVIAGQGSYELPNYVTNIRMVLYLGKEVFAKTGTKSRLTGDIPFGTSQTIPVEYQTSGMGMRVIRFLPSPSETIAEYFGDLFTVDADQAAVIIEYYRTASYDEFDHSLMLPDWFRRNLLKDYICWKAFNAEGSQQDLRASAYYNLKMDEDEAYLKTIKNQMVQGYTRVLATRPLPHRGKPGRPVLPTNFGYQSNY